MPEPREDLFTQSALHMLREQAPLAARLRPRSIGEIVGQRHLLGPSGPLRRLIESDRLPSIISVSYTHLTLPTKA